MAGPVRLKWVLGAVALIALAYMNYVLNTQIAPVTGGFLPQTDWSLYRDVELGAFSLAMRVGPYETYHFILTCVDPVFIAAFAGFVGLSFAPHRWGWLLAGVFVLLDGGEDYLLYVATTPDQGWVLVSPDAPNPIAFVAYVTLAKLVLAVGLCVAIVVRWRRG